MKKRTFLVFLSILLSVFCLGGFVACPPAAADYDPLLSWNAGAAKQTIFDFVQEVTNPNSDNYVRQGDRIAMFDNDGTLWTEKPTTIQRLFILDQLGNPLPDFKELASLSQKDVILDDLQLEGMTTEDYQQKAREFLDNSKHPDFGVPYIQVTYQPMVELLNYLRSNDVKVYICSGGGIDFIRSFAEDTYGIPPENIIGSSIQTEFITKDDGSHVLVRKPELVQPINSKGGKVVGIERYIGKKPIMTIGNSDGDLEMLQYTDEQDGPALMMLVHHDDPREYVYDTGAENALREADARGWTVISMKEDFVTVFGNEIDIAKGTGNREQGTGNRE
ncbi:MAG: haloacid dehalogenase-like hydrolase [Moorea sp. SIO3C2]|nr:haloacid dehalogenase-like hydrolase [Moorena sp. SIO3C2]